MRMCQPKSLFTILAWLSQCFSLNRICENASSIAFLDQTLSKVLAGSNVLISWKMSEVEMGSVQQWRWRIYRSESEITVSIFFYPIGSAKILKNRCLRFFQNNMVCEIFFWQLKALFHIFKPNVICQNSDNGCLQFLIKHEIFCANRYLQFFAKHCLRKVL